VILLGRAIDLETLGTQQPLQPSRLVARRGSGCGRLVRLFDLSGHGSSMPAPAAANWQACRYRSSTPVKHHYPGGAHRIGREDETPMLAGGFALSQLVTL